MTRKEAIAILQEEIDCNLELSLREWEERDEQKLFPAIRMAIEALSEDISEDGTLKVNVEDGSKVNRVLVCGDNHFGGLYYPD